MATHREPRLDIQQTSPPFLCHLSTPKSKAPELDLLRGAAGIAVDAVDGPPRIGAEFGSILQSRYESLTQFLTKWSAQQGQLQNELIERLASELQQHNVSGSSLAPAVGSRAVVVDRNTDESTVAELTDIVELPALPNDPKPLSSKPAAAVAWQDQSSSTAISATVRASINSCATPHQSEVQKISDANRRHSQESGRTIAHDLVDREDYLEDAQILKETELSPLRKAAIGVATSHRFEMLTVCVIISNVFIDGIQLEWFSRNLGADVPMGFRIFQWMLTVFFTVELCIKLFAYRSTFFCTTTQAGWNYLDLIIVISSVADTAAEIVSNFWPSFHDEQVGVDSLRVFRIVRITRLLRIMRVARIIKFVRALRTLIYSMMVTMKALVWALLLLFMVVYVFGFLFTQTTTGYMVDVRPVGADSMPPYVLLTQAEFEWCLSGGQDLIDGCSLSKFWGTLLRSMCTLFQAICGGIDWADAAASLVRVGPLWVVIFGCYICLAIFCVLNVINGAWFLVARWSNSRAIHGRGRPRKQETEAGGPQRPR